MPSEVTSPSRPAAGYSAAVLSSSERIRDIYKQTAHLLPPQSTVCDPRFYAASIDEKNWTPLVLAVSREGVVVGLVCAKERKFAGLATGVIYADATLGAMVIADPADREGVLEAAVHRLLDRRGTRGLRVLVPPDGFEQRIINKVVDARPLDVHYGSAQNHCVLNLESNYEQLLDKFGKKTRRNFRYYRRRFESGGHVYVENIPAETFRNVAFDLLDKRVVGADRQGAERALRMLSASPKPIMVGLRHSNGEWLAILGGWFEGGRVVVFFQMNNDRDHSHSALCTVLRGYFFESLIAARIGEVLFWAGVGEPLLKHSWYLPATIVHLDVPTFLWRTMRRVIGWSVRILPSRTRLFAAWVSPEVPSPDSDVA